GPEVDPSPCCHLAEPGQPLRLEPTELVPRGRLRDEQRVRDQDPRSTGMRPEHADRLAALNEQRLVLAEAKQCSDELPKGLWIPRRLPGAAVDDQLFWMLGDLPVEVVEQHAKGRLRLPRPRMQLRATGRTDPREITAELLDEGVHVAPGADGRRGAHLRHASSPTSASTAATRSPE